MCTFSFLLGILFWIPWGNFLESQNWKRPSEVHPVSPLNKCRSPFYKGDLSTLNTSSDSTSPSSPFGFWATLLSVRKVFLRWHWSLSITSILGPGSVLQENTEDIERMNLTCHVFSFIGYFAHMLKWFPEGLISHTIRFVALDEMQGVATK